ncbi:hypothetical protein BKA64DRAFT_194794 [Cadophora sp. MPI-SDFR-AT-0126]|nr:hypothetical protein BKA64DRAFT_194794 [Leotiomycetes sp. MPI-SDFR-AT-0126]
MLHPLNIYFLSFSLFCFALLRSVVCVLIPRRYELFGKVILSSFFWLDLSARYHLLEQHRTEPGHARHAVIWVLVFGVLRIFDDREGRRSPHAPALPYPVHPTPACLPALRAAPHPSQADSTRLELLVGTIPTTTNTTITFRHSHYPSLPAHLIVLPSLPSLPNGIFLLSRDSVSSASIVNIHGTFSSTSASSRRRIASLAPPNFATASLSCPIRFKVEPSSPSRVDR